MMMEKHLDLDQTLSRFLTNNLVSAKLFDVWQLDYKGENFLVFYIFGKMHSGVGLLIHSILKEVYCPHADKNVLQIVGEQKINYIFDWMIDGDFPYAITGTNFFGSFVSNVIIKGSELCQKIVDEINKSGLDVHVEI